VSIVSRFAVARLISCVASATATGMLDVDRYEVSPPLIRNILDLRLKTSLTPSIHFFRHHVLLR